MTFARLLSEALSAAGLPATGDVLSVGLPLLRQLDDLHRSGRVSRLSGLDGLAYDGESLRLDVGHSQEPSSRSSVIRRLNPESPTAGIEVVSRLGVDHGTGGGQAVTSLDVYDDEGALPHRPVFVSGYRAWEQLHGHHDVLTDIHLAGLLLASYATGLDLEVASSLQDLALLHRHLLRLNPNLHPVVAGVLTEMVSPDRHQRPRDLAEVMIRLEHHRDLPPDLDLSDAYESEEDWQRAVLATLRERVFDVSRRNRALFFKPSSTALSLTEASVPLMLNVERIKPDDLLTWTGAGAAAFRSGRRIDLERWCRFEDAPHLAPGLDKLISHERKLRAEHGQGRLRLVVAFLRWADPDTGEVVNSPLITLPAELDKKKGVRDRYRVRVDDEGEINPVLRHVFRKRFGIVLPEAVETDEASIVELVELMRSMVRSTDQSIRIELIDTPRVHVIRRRAQLRVDAYIRRRAQAQASSGRWRRQGHSYDRDDWRPLGLALYRQFVELKDIPLRDLAGAPVRPRRPDSLSAPTGFPATGEREQTQYAVLPGDVDRHRWEVDLCAVTLASLGSRRSSLSRDYEALLSDDPGVSTAEGTPFDALFSPRPKAPRRPEGESISIDQLLVLPADDAQARAVRRGLAGQSFIIQGPPGTGKSQTITNLIAALVGEGKRVLFVCEKRAALDVVAHRLRQVGLGRLVATIHDSQLDRKAFIADLRDGYQSWLDEESGDPAALRERAVADVRTLLNPLKRAFAELDDARGGRRSLAEIIERLVLLRVRGVSARHGLDGDLPAVSDWLEARPRLSAVADALARTGRTEPLGLIDVLRVSPHSLADSDPVVAARTLGDQLVDAIGDLHRAFDGAATLTEITLTSVALVSSHGPLLEVLDDRGLLALLDPDSTTHRDVRSAAEVLSHLETVASDAAPAFDFWRDPPNVEDTKAALAIARAKENSVLKFLNSGWREVKRLLDGQYRYDLHKIRPIASQVLADLLAAQEAGAAAAAQRALIASTYGVRDIGEVIEMASQSDGEPILTALSGSSTTIDVSLLLEALARITQLSGHLVLADGALVSDVERIGRSLQQASVSDERSLIAWAQLADVGSGILRTALDREATLDEIERVVLDTWLDRAGVSSSMASISGASLDHAVEQLADRYQALLRANADFVAGVARERFREHVEFSEASMAGRSDADKARKRSYRAGRKLLEREFEKKMRYRSIRELAGGESGDVVRDLKPVWLMSPLSVADTLPLDDELFDVVIFDEASQIPVEDAVPTLFRASQAIVVGDRMQLPPTRFFSTGDDDDGGVTVEDGDARITISLEADSFLAQADLALDSTMLTWHYRSRSESLIAYSNHAFYNARLATVPDRSFADREREPITVTSSDEAASCVDSALGRPISFHMISHGVYEDRRNTAEADYIAELIRAMLLTEVGHTIGVVAFSEAQQTAIESSLAELAVLDRRFAARLEDEQLRTDDDEFVGLFVKNLENVQGDERDVIIMSVCYGRNRDGKMRMNFGPINQAGGERRLNVIFSRAKKHMMVVSSIVGDDITNVHNDGAAHLARFLDYADAESGGGRRGDAILRSLHPGGDEPRDEATERRSAVAVEIAEQLRSRGHDADVGVGRSAFTLDVAVRAGNDYVLGVMVDPGDGSSPTARLIAEAGVLDAMDWPITRVLITEWWSEPGRVVDRIEHRLDSS